MKKKNAELMVTTGIRRKVVFVEIECPDLAVCEKVLAIVDHWIDELKMGVTKND